MKKLIGFAAGMIAGGFIFNRLLKEKPEINEEARAKASGSFVKLSDGYTHYELLGEGTKGCALLIHGASIPYYIWDRNVSTFLEAGYKVLRYDLYGRGYSDRPRIEYSSDLYVKQAEELLYALDIRDDILVAGISLGGAIAACFAENNKERVKKAIFIDPAGPYYELSKGGRLFLNSPIPEIILKLIGEELLSAQSLKGFMHPEENQDFKQKFIEQNQYYGLKEAMLSTFRNSYSKILKKAYLAVNKAEISPLVIWGQDDKVIPIKYMQTLKKYLPNAKYYVVENAGHVSHYEQAKEVNGVIADFIK